jgi:hypothetical protein
MEAQLILSEGSRIMVIFRPGLGDVAHHRDNHAARIDGIDSDLRSRQQVGGLTKLILQALIGAVKLVGGVGWRYVDRKGPVEPDQILSTWHAYLLGSVAGQRP